MLHQGNVIFQDIEVETGLAIPGDIHVDSILLLLELLRRELHLLDERCGIVMFLDFIGVLLLIFLVTLVVLLESLLVVHGGGILEAKK